MGNEQHIKLKTAAKKLSIIIVSFNACDLLIDCLRSIRQSGLQIPHEVIVVDNASADESVARVRADFPETILLVNARNIGFAAANNQGLRRTSADYVLLLNSDTRVTDGAIDTLVEFLESNPDAAAAAPMLLNDDGSWQRSFFRFPSAWRTFLNILGISRFLLSLLKSSSLPPSLSRIPGLDLYAGDFDLEKPRKVAYVLFACILLRREVLAEVGLLDEGLFFYHEDCEYGYRLAHAGLPIYWVPFSKVIHLGGGTSRGALRESFKNYYTSLVYVFRKHESWITALTVKMLVCLGFLIRAALTPFGIYKYLEIPSTYARTPADRVKAFGSSVAQSRYYGSLTLLPWRS